MYTQRLLIVLIVERVLRWGSGVTDESTRAGFEGILEDERKRAAYTLFSEGIGRALHDTMAPCGMIDPTWSRLGTAHNSRPAHEQIADKMIDYATFQCGGKSARAVALVLDRFRMFIIHLDGVGVEVTSREASRIEALFTDATMLNALQRPWFRGTDSTLPQA